MSVFLCFFCDLLQASIVGVVGFGIGCFWGDPTAKKEAVF
jgi:hypothetical protein